MATRSGDDSGDRACSSAALTGAASTSATDKAVVLAIASDGAHIPAAAAAAGDTAANALDEQRHDTADGEGGAADDGEHNDNNDSDDADSDNEHDEDGGSEQVEAVEPDECCICRDVVALLSQGILPVCDHKFHFECIVAWAKVTNLCPLCKQQFHEVMRVDASGAVVHREAIADCKQVFRPDPADHDIAAQLRLVNEARCEICGRGDDEHVLLMCEARGCAISNHTYCIGLAEVPSSSWYCSRHASGTRASDFIERRATTVSSRRTTRRLAHLMSNVLSGRDGAPGRDGSRRGRGSMPQSTASRGGARSARRGASARVTLESDSGRPIRGIAAAYALRMSQELQQIHRRAELMYARGDHNQLALGAASNRHVTLSRSTPTAPVRVSSVDLMWQDFDASRQEIAAAQNALDSARATAESSPYTSSSRVSRTLAPEYRELAKLMVDAVSSDNYASTVSLVIPKTAKLRLVSRVKTFFTRLNSRERVAVLDMGCLEVLFKWIARRETSSASLSASSVSSTSTASVSPHPQVLDAVLTVVEALPVRQKDLLEVPNFRTALDEIAALPDVSVELRERAILTSERWRDLDPPARTALDPPARPEYWPADTNDTATESLPAIRAFSAQKQPARRSKEKMRRPEAWTEPAIQYVKAKLYPLYKHGNGKLSKERFKAIVKQVLELFRPEAAAMQSQIVLSTGELSSVAKTRLKTLIDRSYKASSVAGVALSSAAAGLSSSSYSAMPSTKHHRAS